MIASNQKQQEHFLFNNGSLQAGDCVGRLSVIWSVVRFVSFFFTLFFCYYLSSFFFLLLKGAEDDLRKVTDLAYKQVSYYFSHSGLNY